MGQAVNADPSGLGLGVGSGFSAWLTLTWNPSAPRLSGAG